MSCTSVETRPPMIILTSIAAAALAVVGAGDLDLLVTDWSSEYFLVCILNFCAVRRILSDKVYVENFVLCLHLRYHY